MILDPDLPAAWQRRDVDILCPEQSAGARRGQAALAASPTSSFADVAARIAEEEDSSGVVAERTGEKKTEKSFSLWENGDFGFGDLVDIINPLQHLPIVATIYRNLSGDRIGALPRVVGGALWGRIGGFVTGAVNAVVEWFTGKDIGDHIYAFLRDKLAAPQDNSQLAHDADSREPVKDAPEVTEFVPREHVSHGVALPEKLPDAEVRAPLAVRTFEDLPSRPPTDAGFNHAAFRYGISFRYGVDDDRGRTADRERRVRLTA
jgi:hypothetical protein